MWWEVVLLLKVAFGQEECFFWRLHEVKRGEPPVLDVVRKNASYEESKWSKVGLLELQEVRDAPSSWSPGTPDQCTRHPSAPSAAPPQLAAVEQTRSFSFAIGFFNIIKQTVSQTFRSIRILEFRARRCTANVEFQFWHCLFFITKQTVSQTFKSFRILELRARRCTGNIEFQFWHWIFLLNRQLLKILDLLEFFHLVQTGICGRDLMYPFSETAFPLNWNFRWTRKIFWNRPFNDRTFAFVTNGCKNFSSDVQQAKYFTSFLTWFLCFPSTNVYFKEKTVIDTVDRLGKLQDKIPI